MVGLLAWVADAARADDWTDAWRGSRWILEVEETTASGVMFRAEENRSFRTRALQVSAVVTCPEVAAGKSSAVLSCTFEALALRATPRSQNAAEVLADVNDNVLQDMVRRMRSTPVEVTVTDDGKVTAVDLPGLKGTTRWESESRETLRRIAWDLVAGWSMKRPESWEAGWVEKNTPLLRPPLEPGATGLSKTEHVFALVEGTKVVSSTGHGSFTAPYVPWESTYVGKSVHVEGTKGGATKDANGAPTGGTRDTSGRMTEATPDTLANTPSDMTLSGDLRSVAVFDDGGHLAERIYTMAAKPTASSLGNMQGLSVTTNAHLRRLAPDEAADVGATTIVAPRGTTIEGIPTWEPIPTF